MIAGGSGGHRRRWKRARPQAAHLLPLRLGVTWASRRAPVEAGRRSTFSTGGGAPRPRLEGIERGATLGDCGTFDGDLGVLTGDLSMGGGPLASEAIESRRGAIHAALMSTPTGAGDLAEIPRSSKSVCPPLRLPPLREPCDAEGHHLAADLEFFREVFDQLFILDIEYSAPQLLNEMISGHQESGGEAVGFDLL